MAERQQITEWPSKYVTGGKRANIHHDSRDWFVGTGKDESCYLEGTWWDMICLARSILASKNTELVAPEYFKPEWQNTNYDGEEKPYQYEGDE